MIGRHCRWCQASLHNKCVAQWRPECDLGSLACHIIPPDCIYPAVLERQRSSLSTRVSEASEAEAENVAEMARKISVVPTSFQISPKSETKPLLVFVNPKSGGKQGEKSVSF